MNLRIPGPTPCPSLVLEAMKKQMIDHRGKEFGQIMHHIAARLREFFQTKGDVLILTCSGTGSMEAAVANTLSPGDRVLSICNGTFGERFADIAEAFGADVKRLRFDLGKGAEAGAVREALEADPSIEAVTITHNETSTGVTNDLESISAVVKGFDKFLMVDAISSMGCINLPMDAWGCDVVLSGSQKGWMVPPGLAFVGLSQRAWDAVAKAKMPRFYWDFKKAKSNAEKGQTPWTPAVSIFYALAVSLELMAQEGLPNIIARHERIGKAAREGAKSLGLSLFADERYASNTVTAINTPPGVDVDKLLALLRDEYDTILASSRGEMEVFRIGHLGFVTEDDIDRVMEALNLALMSMGVITCST